MVYSEHRFLANLKSCPVPHGSLLSADNSCSPLKNESLGNSNNNGYLPVYLCASFLYFCYIFFLRHRLQLCSTQHRGNPAYEPYEWSQKGKIKKNIRERKRFTTSGSELAACNSRGVASPLLQTDAAPLTAPVHPPSRPTSTSLDCKWPTLKVNLTRLIGQGTGQPPVYYLSCSPSESIPYKWPVTVPSTM